MAIVALKCSRLIWRRIVTSISVECFSTVKAADVSNAIVFVLVCAVKVFCSLFGGSDISKLLDLPTFYFMFAVIILECKENRLKGNFYKHLRSTSETMYFIHMYFVAFCALVLYKDDYNNFKSYLICAGGALAVSEIYSWMKNISNRSTTVSRLKHD